MDHQGAIAVVGGIFIALLFFAKFNTWAPTEAKAKSANPPRHFTTCGRYVSFAIAYTAIYEVLYVFIVSFPDIAPVLADAAKSYSLPIPGFDLKSFQQNPSLWSVIIVAAVLPSLPEKVNLDFYLRDWLHRRAFITSEADSTVEDLRWHFEKFAPRDDVIEKVLKRGLVGTEKEDFLNKRDSVSHKWAKLSYLTYLFQRWEAAREVKQFLECYEGERQRLETDYDELRAAISQYRAEVRKRDRTGVKKRGSSDVVKLLEPGLSKTLDDKLKALYTLITCGVLTTTRTPAQRRAAFAYFGLHPESKPTLPFDADTIALSVAIVFLATLVPVMIYSAFGNTGNNKNIPFAASPAVAVLWSAISLFLQGSAVLIAFYVNRLWLKYQTTVDTDRTILFLRPSLLRRLACAASAYVVGFGVLVVSALFMSRDNPGLPIQQILPWPLVSAVTGYFVSRYLTAFVNLKRGDPEPAQREQWWDALKYALASAMAGVMASLLFFGHPWITPDEAPFVVVAVSTMFIVGLGIGYVFPRGYRKHRQERRAQPRYKVAKPVQISDAGGSIACQLTDVSVAGASLDGPVTQSAAQIIRLNSRNLGVVLAKVVRTENKRTCVEFLHDSDTKQKLSNYVLALAGPPG
jgi:hypothetical protein